MITDPIYIGFDMVSGNVYAMYGKFLIRLDKWRTERGFEILNGLGKVGERLPLIGTTETVIDGEDVVVTELNPFQLKVQYSEQAWSDLLEIGTEIEKWGVLDTLIMVD